ncbi:transporter substrate-binding domain-containing protein [Marinomonas sp. M1K-6]|uniref:Transporter substrate-binding domain-containing protein n=1 Tax=Marinomonas profundi TaxID=2726122 RepID=A0A847RAH4_9GAMM|nr:transporter substrate-binding domain-containing protein [Marinomonas profundi]NLQ17240.1 transporter substrate-binding domain-containing protein [Marinomonas profundi]UDV04570.1 transporter substrate-binding domain-containing protein [Marinomonas profundi]
MKRLSRLLWLCGWATGLSVSSVSAEEIVLQTVHLPPRIIDAAILPPPAGFADAGSVYGFDVEILRAAYATQGVTVRIELRPWKRVMRDVEEGLVLGAISCRQVPLREAFADFSNPLSNSVSTFVTRRGYLDAEPSTLDILQRYQVAAVNGWAQTNILDDAKIPYFSVTGLEQGINLVLRRNHDIFMTERDSVMFVAKQMGVMSRLSFYDVTALSLDHYSVCFSKQYPDSKKWRDRLNKGLDELERSGKKEEIFKRYGFSSTLD